jgi:hypothetical protein
VVPVWVAYIVRWRVMRTAVTQLLPVAASIRLGFSRIYLPWAAVYLLFLVVKPYTPLRAQETLFDWCVRMQTGRLPPPLSHPPTPAVHSAPPSIFPPLACGTMPLASFPPRSPTCVGMHSAGPISHLMRREPRRVATHPPAPSHLLHTPFPQPVSASLPTSIQGMASPF